MFLLYLCGYRISL